LLRFFTHQFAAARICRSARGATLKRKLNDRSTP
jgi:hypothetical protein